MEGRMTYRLAIYLMKDTYYAFNSCLRLNNQYILNSYKLKPSLGVDGEVFIADTQERDSMWLNLLQQGVEEEIPKLVNSSNRAVLFMRLEDRIFACPFGYGSVLLNPSAIERNFGLKAAVNSLNEDKIRSIDKADLGELTIQTRVQSSMKTNKNYFNLDIIGDLLTSITGESSDRLLGSTITGKDAVYINPRIEFADISHKIKTANKYYLSKKYLKNFGWIDNLRYEKDDVIIDNLNEALLESLKKKDNTLIQLAPPNIMDWTKIEGISFTPEGELQPDFDIQYFYNNVEDIESFTIEKLKRYCLYIEDGLYQNRSQLRLMKCLNYQIELGGFLYVRTLGKWYKIDKSFADQINHETQKIEKSQANYIDCQHDWNEEKYNKELADSDKDHVLFDRKLVRCESTKTNIEPCDVMTRKKEFIHVKPKNSSSTLSHLFAQGRVASIAFTSDESFRKGMRSIIKESGKFHQKAIPLRKVNNSKYTVTFATITKGDTPMIEKLPFFSLVNLRQTAKFLFEHGFDVRVKKIKKLEKQYIE